MTSLDSALCMPWATLTIMRYREVSPWACGNRHKGNLSGGLSGVTGNCHARFLGGLGMATSPGYPTEKHRIMKRDVLGKGQLL
jgi:hypothetical protein